MNTYLAGTDVKLTVSFTDNDGNPLSVTSATYKVVDDRSNEVVPQTSFNPLEKTLTIAADFNQIAALDVNTISSEQIDEVRLNEARIVEFELVLDDGNVHPIDIVYILVPRERLIAGLNSFQSLREAYLNTMLMAETQSWMSASEDERISAMIEAHLRICSFQFRDGTVGQSYLSESTIIGDLSLIPPKEFNALSAKFRKALRLAQIAEACEILGGGDQSTLYRRNGLTSQTIGETQETYRSAAPVDLRLSKAALRYLGSYISLNLRVGRAG